MGIPAGQSAPGGPWIGAEQGGFPVDVGRGGFLLSRGGPKKIRVMVG
jgi:hypothetical protein